MNGFPISMPMCSTYYTEIRILMTNMSEHQDVANEIFDQDRMMGVTFFRKCIRY